MQYRGGDLSVIENCACNDQSLIRETFLDNCVPLYNMIRSKMNLAFVEGSNVYTIYHSLPDSANYVVDQTNGNITVTPTQINPDETFDDKMDVYLDKKITIGTKEIPLYYMYIKCEDIFDISLANHKPFMDDIFRYTKDDKKFVGMSLTFNIFN